MRPSELMRGSWRYTLQSAPGPWKSNLDACLAFSTSAIGHTTSQRTMKKSANSVPARPGSVGSERFDPRVRLPSFGAEPNVNVGKKRCDARKNGATSYKIHSDWSIDLIRSVFRVEPAWWLGPRRSAGMNHHRRFFNVAAEQVGYCFQAAINAIFNRSSML